MNCGGRFFDNAVNKRRQHCGLHARMQQEEPRAPYVHGLAQIVNLVLQGMSEEVECC